MHPGEKRMELTIGQHFYWSKMREQIKDHAQKCDVCQRNKKRNAEYGFLPPKNAEVVPWHTCCIDLIGPYTIGPDKPKSQQTLLWALTMIDPATGWFEIVTVPTKRADYISNIFEQVWLNRYPFPTEVVMDRGKEFKAEVEDMLKNEYGIARKVITTRNPQANAMVERCHKTISALVIKSLGLKAKDDLEPYGDWDALLSAVAKAHRSTVHTTLDATPSQLVFGRDTILNVSFEADWQYIKDRKQKLILQNNKRENSKRKPYTYHVGDKVMVLQDPKRKFGNDQAMQGSLRSSNGL